MCNAARVVAERREFLAAASGERRGLERTRLAARERRAPKRENVVDSTACAPSCRAAQLDSGGPFDRLPERRKLRYFATFGASSAPC